MPNKTQILLRQDMLKVLGNLDMRWVESASKRVCQHLSTLITEELLSKNSYDAIISWNTLEYDEDLHSVPDVTDFLLEYDKLPTYVRSNEEDSEGRVFAKIEGVDAQTKDFLYGGKLSATPDLSLIMLLPGIVYDELGNRLGFGDNIHQRLLQSSKFAHVTLIGVAWSLQLLDSFPERPEDLVVDWLCTEEGYNSTHKEFT